MEPVLLIDFGSTFTKVAAVDVESCTLLGTASSYTTVQTDIGDGLENALTQLFAKIGTVQFSLRLACSSAAGGLKMVASGLVPELTSTAAKLASLGAGAKVAKVYSYQLTDEDVEEIAHIRPDLFLLTGGTDGGNTACALYNAKMLAGCKARFPVILAGNRTCQKECESLLADWEVLRCENVLPKLGQINPTPAQKEIRALFLKNIIQAKGLSKVEALVSGILMPTPSAVLTAMELLAAGTKNVAGIGELVAVDLGGATTDVYSIAAGMPLNQSTVIKGLIEPYAKRTVEGDIGMRWGARGVLEAVGAEKLAAVSGLSEARVEELVTLASAKVDTLPQRPELEALDFALASCAIETATTRHAGSIEQTYTPVGPVYVQTGKDLTEVKNIVVTGGAVINATRCEEIAACAGFDSAQPFSLRPKAANVFVDRRYILSAMGLLAERFPDQALTIMKKELSCYGNNQ